MVAFKQNKTSSATSTPIQTPHQSMQANRPQKFENNLNKDQAMELITKKVFVGVLSVNELRLYVMLL
ncbi:hypothetical protein BGZ81_011003 [Podila clonocystis]|nr:hypothetical protein BGZ81_011003 [Podila clonocystis]